MMKLKATKENNCFKLLYLEQLKEEIEFTSKTV